MKALYKMKFGPDCMEYVTDAPEPSPKADQIKVKVYGCCVCGTDIHLMHDEYACNPPVITGHEVSGTVVEVGADVTNFKVGDEIVTSTAIETCESCEWCKQGRRMLCANRKSLGSGANGGFAEYVVVPAKLAFHKPSSISLQTAALCEPFACCVRAVAERTEITAGDYVLVAGAGVMAQMCARIAKANGASVIMTGLEADATRFETARNESGVLATVRVDEGDPLAEIMRLTNGDGVSVAYECSGSAASTDFCIQALKKTGVYMGSTGKALSAHYELQNPVNSEEKLNIL